MAKSGVPTTLEAAGDRTGKIRVADTLPDPDSEDSVPIHRVRGRSREDSGAMASFLLDQANDVAHRRLGRGVPDELRSIMADALTDGVEDLVSSLREEFSKSKNPKEDPPAGLGLQRWTFVIAITTSVALILSLIVGSLAIMRMTDRLLEFDSGRRSADEKLSEKIAEAEKAADQLMIDFEAAKEVHADQDRRLNQIEVRQDALVIYVLKGVDLLLEDRHIPKPDIPPILQIAKAEIMLKYGVNHDKK